MTTTDPPPPTVPGWRRRIRIAVVALAGLGVLAASGYGTYLAIRYTRDQAAGTAPAPPTISASPTPTRVTNAELASAAVEKALRAWSAAEGGDSSACARAADYIHADSDSAVTTRCAAEVGSHPGERLTRFATSQVHVNGRTGSVHVEGTYVSDDRAPGVISTDFRVRKVDGVWKIDWSSTR